MSDSEDDSGDEMYQIVEIEEVTSETLPANELSQFVPASTIPIIDSPAASTSFKPTPQVHHQKWSSPPTGTPSIPAEQEALLIKQLINGELSFGDYNMQIGQIVNDNINEPDEMDDEDDDEEADDPMSANQSSTNFETELLQSRRDAIRGNLKGRTVGKDGKVKKRCVLPVALQGLMGEANLCYARGKTDLAEKVCLEIIRQVPLAPEPFLTLAQIYESNPEKYMQFSLIAAHLNPGDVEQWMRIAQLSVEHGNIKQAINCYMKATKYNPRDNDLRLKRIKLLKQIGEEKLAFRVYCSMLAYIPNDEPEFILQTAKYIATQWLTEKQPERALDAMNVAYAKCGARFPSEDVNFYLEVLIDLKHYKRALDVLTEHAGIVKSVSDDEAAGSDWVTALHIPDTIILDFRTKLIVCLIRLRCFNLIPQLLENIFTHIEVESAGDCYLDIAEALMVEERFADALQLLEPLVKSKNFSMAAVWLRYADCNRAVGNIEQAIDSYRQVVVLAPMHFDARLTLSALLKGIGRTVDAMSALEQDMDNEMVDPYVMYERCYMLRENGQVHAFIENGFQLLSRHVMTLRNTDEMVIATTIVKFSSKAQLIRDCRLGNLEPVDDVEVAEFAKSDNSPTVNMEWTLFKDIVKAACDLHMFPMMQKITFTMMMYKPFLLHLRDLEFYAMLAALYNRCPQFAFRLSKDKLEKNLYTVKMWNLFNIVVQFTESTRYGRYLFRLFKRIDMSELPLLIMRANYFLMSGSLKYAFNDYTVLFKRNDDPLLPLMLSVTLSHMAQQKHIQKRENLMAQSLAFAAKYREGREAVAEPEVHYNLGRLYQTFGVMHLAVSHYMRVLSHDSELFTGVNERLLGLKQEAAYNLHLVYMESGNRCLARKVLADYIVI